MRSIFRRHSPVVRSVRNGAGVVAGALLLSAAGAVAAVAQEEVPTELPSEVRSTQSGVYTHEQADQGLEIYQNICSNCHNEANPLSGEKFRATWAGQSLYRLYEFMQTRMPYGNPGSLTAEQYSAVVAYVLRENGYPAGDTALPTVPLEIAYINLDPLAVP